MIDRRALAAALLLGSSALADDAPSAENVAAAKVLFDDAQKLMDEKRFPEACAKFRASQRNLPKVGTLLNLADCYEKNGQTASAWATYNDAIALGRKQNRPEYEDFAKHKTTDLEARLVRLTIVVSKDARAPGMKIERDGSRVDEGEWNTDVPVDPGKHEIVVTAPKKLKWQTEIEVSDKSVSANVPPLTDAPQAWPSGSQPEVIEKVVVKPSPLTTLRIVGIATGAVGIGAVVTGAILGVAAKSTYDDAFARCSMNASSCPADAVSDGKTAHAMAGVATALFIAGSVFTAAGVTLVLVGGPKDQGAQVTLGPGQLSLGGRF